ncbi:hypothetical protein M2451_000408 [Dysgonomonas sp. PFB1-18]|uniref:porin family protein n=1 Tax=unclassified Dysgonomonas TaxID=2630389 RepID=UPI0024757170|nr:MULTISPECIES: porin family protein [unclassified Dysgonomonas]MDH6307259.1 hypothetical protein [Dysgonomonas sp. PF1-14]MDH6337177.1 hypothetical protein [Dysgonomonas sp. PF1-16]MDH6379101.1 hypothetical protein [Dysgonomonas sp. PFB1-18]MDH6396262.1 hypothetical protein [Dysgonomonas sp. PF1-23]
MRTILKTSLVAIALLIGVSASAQDTPITFGVKVGANLSNFSGDVEDTKAKFGFNAGVTLDYAITPDIYLLTGLEFTMKGAKAEYGEEYNGVSVEVTEKANPMYLQLPVHIGYKLAIADNTKLVFHAGPYVAYGIAGKAKVEYKGSVAGIDLSGKAGEHDFFGSEEDGGYKRFDFGLGLGVGAEFGKIGVGLGYDFGLLNMSRGDAKVRNMNAYLTLGYKF